MDIAAFIQRWTASGASERANKDLFFTELCEVLGVERPRPATGNPTRDTYAFERDAILRHEGGATSIGKIDLYKDDCFVLEAKQGSDSGSKKHGSARRDTPAWNIAMRDAFGQALQYVETLEKPPPFIVTCDIGHCFDLYAAFSAERDYRPFPNARQNRIWFKDMADERHQATLRAIFTDPRALDPERLTTKVTREVAGHLAELAKALEQDGHVSELVAEFLMRCIFTMFAEDVGLLPAQLFTRCIEDRWLAHPERFKAGVETLWRTMDKGGATMDGDWLLQFNGGLFRDPSGLPLKREHLELLLEAARCDWSEVEPSIFGTLLERALNPRERHRLGAHYTPRAYVERLVRATVEEPLRAEWEDVQAAVRIHVKADRVDDARKAVRLYYQKLCKTRVLDPACGTGNFLYVTLDLFKRLESEVWAQLSELGEGQERLEHEGSVVTPAQFHGIEVKRWAKEIAELVLWIGHLQWYRRTHGKTQLPPEPVLRNYKNIECRDAVLAYDREEFLLDEQGRPVMRWDGVTMKTSPVTGEEIPDENAKVPVAKFVNPRKAEWPEVEFIVGNPPFVGNKRMRTALGDGYVEALRRTWDDVPETVDFVMYWWNRAAELVRGGKAKRFGLITTNSITQTFNRKVLSRHLDAKDRLSVFYAIPDHPWVDASDGAAVRIAMTAGVAGAVAGVIDHVVSEKAGADDDICVELRRAEGNINADLTIGTNVPGASKLLANTGMSFQGPILVGEGFRVEPEELLSLGLRPDALPPVVKPYVIGKDIVQRRESRFVIDFFGLSQDEARTHFPRLFQVIVDRVKPHRDSNKDPGFRERWWLWGRPRPDLRDAVRGLRRYAVTVETSKHKPFVFLPSDVCPDHKLYVIASDDAFHLGVLSSRVHKVWALAAGGRMGIGNDPTWTNSTCFLPFPFPPADSIQTVRIREFGEALDAHRKKQQAQYPTVTLTGMYNVLEKLRAGEPLNAKDKVIHEQGLVSVLKQLHDDLDAAVFDAYGWPHDVTDEQILEHLVALNAQRAEEERHDLVRWLRPEFQAQTETKPTQITIGKVDKQPKIVSASARPWPKDLAERIAVVRTCLRPRIPADVEAIASNFKRAKRADVEAVLQALSALGLAIVYDTHEGPKWCSRMSRAA